jgi:hypothetical protein
MAPFSTSWQNVQRSLKRLRQGRYLKGRLQTLKRPTVWGSAAAILVLLLGINDYWQRQRSGGPDPESASPTGVASLDTLQAENQLNVVPSREDSAIAADIDTLPLLLDDFEVDPTDAEENSLTEEEENGTSAGLSTPFPALTGGDSTSSNPEALPDIGADLDFNIFASDAGVASIDRSNPFLPAPTATGRYRPIPDTASSGGFFSTPNAVPGSDRPSLLQPPATTNPATTPLQDALQRYGLMTGDRSNDPGSRSPAPSTSPGLIPGQVPGSVPGLETTPQANPLVPGQTDSIPNRNPSPFWRTSPPAGTTGYTIPSTLQPSPTPGSIINSPTAPAVPSSGNTYVDSFTVSPSSSSPGTPPVQVTTPPRPSYGSGVVYPSPNTLPLTPTPAIPVVPGYTNPTTESASER